MDVAEPISWMVAIELSGWGWVLFFAVIAVGALAVWVETHKARQAGKRRNWRE